MFPLLALAPRCFSSQEKQIIEQIVVLRKDKLSNKSQSQEKQIVERIAVVKYRIASAQLSNAINRESTGKALERLSTSLPTRGVGSLVRAHASRIILRRRVGSLARVYAQSLYGRSDQPYDLGCVCAWECALSTIQCYI